MFKKTPDVPRKHINNDIVICLARLASEKNTKHETPKRFRKLSSNPVFTFRGRELKNCFIPSNDKRINTAPQPEQNPNLIKSESIHPRPHCNKTQREILRNYYGINETEVFHKGESPEKFIFDFYKTLPA